VTERETHHVRSTGEGDTLWYVPISELERIQACSGDPRTVCALLADACRLNTLYMISRTGSGHIGSSFSAMDVVTWLWTQELVRPNDPVDGGEDVYFSSKGHDVPGLYAVLAALGKLDFELIHRLRRLGGLPGHPDVSTPYIAANTGSLGMGISKAYGMVMANRERNRPGRVFVMTGDGELQEGQIWESLQPAANARMGEITVIVDHNKMQSDAAVRTVSDLGDLESKFRAFGWCVDRCDGHDTAQFATVLGRFRTVADRPHVLIADTIKGRGVSFMEGIALGDETYKFHAGAPCPADYRRAVDEVIERLSNRLVALGQDALRVERAERPRRDPPKRPARIVEAYGDELVELARERGEIVVLDADLLTDCGIVRFKKELPERFVECGIAEQHMVSVAGGMALRGLLPVAHSYGSFLSARANEQIYNNATERKKVIYVGTLAGVLPGGPGVSHQSVRDISAVGAIPGLVMIQPCTEGEAKRAIRWAVERNDGSTWLRFANVPLDLDYELPPDYVLTLGRGAWLRRGRDAVIIAYGPVMLQGAIEASGELARQGHDVGVVNLPWLNRVDEEWLKSEVGTFPLVVTLDDHYLPFGQGCLVSSTLARVSARAGVASIGLEVLPACGWNPEVLAYQGLDGLSLARSIQARIRALS
jgi:transketolase